MIAAIKEFYEKNKKWIFVFLCTFPFFNDVFVPYQSYLDLFVDHAKTIVVIFLLVLFIVKRKKISSLLIALFAYETWWLISTLLNYPISDSYTMMKTYYDILCVVAMGLIIEFFRDDPSNMIKGLMLNMELALYPNFISLFLLGSFGERATYVLGFYSVLILWLMPALCIATLNILINRERIRSVILIAVILFTTIYISCATITIAFLGMVGVIALGLIIIRVFKLKKAKVLLSVFLCLAILLNLFVLFAYNGGSFPLIDIFFEKFLNRSTTFTGRVGIWEAAIEMIKDKPVIGHGFRPEVVRADGFRVIHAHNQLLQVLNARGIIGMILFALFHVILCIKVDKSENTFERLIMTGACFGIFLTYITEAYKKFFRFYLVFFLAYHIDELIRDKINNKDYLFK